MDKMIKCDCYERHEVEINSIKLLDELKTFFTIQVKNEIFDEIFVISPYQIGYSANQKKYEWYADKWYKCKRCGTLWEMKYPDFPAKGFVRKFSNGIHNTIRR